MKTLYAYIRNCASQLRDVIPAQAGIQYLIKHFWIPAFAGMTVTLCACGSVGTGIANPPDQEVAQAAAMVGAMFAGQGGDSNVAVKITYHSVAKSAPCEDPQATVCHCDNVIAQGNEDPRATFAANGDPGTYGSLDNSITVTESDFCALPNGDPADGTGPDDGGLFATVEVISNVDATCTSDGTDTVVSMKAGSTGIWRDTEEYRPEVYGNFTFGVDDSEATLDCTLFLNDEGGVEFSDCSDSDGNSITVDDDVACSFDDI